MRAVYSWEVRTAGSRRQLPQLHQRILDRWRLEWRHNVHILRRGLVEQRFFGKLLSMCCRPLIFGWRLMVRGLCGGDLREFGEVRNVYSMFHGIFCGRGGVHQLQLVHFRKGAGRHWAI